MKFLRNIINQIAGKPVDWDELEEELFRADLGLPMTQRIIDKLRLRGYRVTADEVEQETRREIVAVLPPKPQPIQPLVDGRPKVVLMVGVNGTGKTTSSAKLCRLLQERGYSSIMVAGDTFRAAAIEQLELWGESLGVEVVKGKYGADPAALCYDAWQKAKKNSIDFVICDTAGRLHTKHNLMEELSKVRRVLQKNDESAPHEVFLVVDASTGGNAVVQAREFNKHMELTGLVVTKIDGSGKGGVVVAIQHELKVPCRFVGTGEKAEDFMEFDPEWFAAEMV